MAKGLSGIQHAKARFGLASGVPVFSSINCILDEYMLHGQPLFQCVTELAKGKSPPLCTAEQVCLLYVLFLVTR